MLPAPASALAVLMMTLVPALRAALISTTPMEAGLPTGSNTPALKEPALPAAMTTSDGSNNHVPDCPSADDASTLPNACKLSCELVSINPPLPLAAALASIVPKNPVYSFDHTITRPPLPL